VVDVHYIESVSQIRAIAEPTRWRMLSLLVVRPMTGSQLARALKIPRARAHYHLNILREVGLVELQHQGLNGGMVEKYYSAIARDFRTDHLVDRSRLASRQSGDDLGTGQVVHDLMLAMLEVARTDLLLPDAVPGLAQAGFNLQDELLLTVDEINDLIQGMRDVFRRSMDADRQNRLDPQRAALLRLRLTALLTPVAALQSDSRPANGHAAEAKPVITPAEEP
jgi:DNA-binding transcriptional ArsR family regulator